MTSSIDHPAAGSGGRWAAGGDQVAGRGVVCRGREHVRRGAWGVGVARVSGARSYNTMKDEPHR